MLLDARGVGRDVVLNQSVLAGSDVSVLASGSVVQNANIDAILGSIDVRASAGDINMAPTVASTAGADIRIEARDNVQLSTLSALDSNVSVLASNGAITDVQIGDTIDGIDFNGFAIVSGRRVNIFAEGASLQAGISVGTGDSAIDTEVTALAAAAGSGSVHILESDGVNVGSPVVASVNRVGLDSNSTPISGLDLDGVIAGNDAKIETVSGDLSVSRAITAGNDILLAADDDLAKDAGLGDGTALGIVTLGVDAVLTATSGNVSVLGEQSVAQFANITAGGTVDVEAYNGNIFMSDDALSTATNDLRYLASNGEITLGGLAADNVRVEANGAIIDGGDTNLDINAPTGGIQLISTTDSIGSAANSIEIDGGSLAVSATRGGAYLNEADDLSIAPVDSITLQRVTLDNSFSNLTTSPLSGVTLSSVSGVGVFSFVGSGVVIQDDASPIDIHTLTGAISGGELRLFNELNEVDEVGDFTLTNGGDLFLFDSGRRRASDDQALLVTGDVGGLGSTFLVVGGVNSDNDGGLTIESTASVISSVPSGNPRESILLVAGLRPTEGLPGGGELRVFGDRTVDVRGNSQLTIVTNSTNAIDGTFLGGVASEDLRSLNFSFDPSGTFSTELNSELASGFNFDNFASLLAEGTPGDFNGIPSFVQFQAPQIDTDAAAQAGDVSALLDAFFSELQDEEETIGTDDKTLSDILNARFAGESSGLYYGPYAVTSYEYDQWIAENEIGVDSQNLFNRQYPLYLLGENGKPPYRPIYQEQ